MTSFDSARQQCLRALDIIDSTQLDVFLQRDLPTRSSLLAQIEQLRPLPEGQAVEGMRKVISDLLSVYNDPFANYISPEQHKQYAQKRKGGFVGLGLKFRTRKGNYPVVIGPLLGGPLENQNIKTGDEIIKVGELDVSNLPSVEIGNAMRGTPASSVLLTLRRNNKSFSLEATRTAVKVYYARATMLNDRVGYIRISRFGGSTHEKVKQLLEDLLTRSMQALVLDLRDNPGGSTRAARNIMSLFERAPWVYCEKYKSGKVRKLPREGDTITDIPLVVLVNEYSMSSSEILAGALQNYKRAKLVGAPTYGKGLIQKVFPLAEPIGGAVRTTIAMYGTPSHQLIHGRGLLPDLYVPSAPARLFMESGSLNISDEARSFRKGLTLTQLQGQYSENQLTALKQLPDTQLQTALSLLA